MKADCELKNDNISKKLIPLYVIDLLEEETDKDNALLPSEIRKKINGKYGDGAIKKVETLIDNIEAINNYFRSKLDGIDLIQYIEESKTGPYRKNKRYYLAERKLDIAEVKYLQDILMNSKTLGERERHDIYYKLSGFLSKKQREYTKEIILYDGSVKTPNRDVYINLDEIQKAIHNKQNIIFTYNQYNMQKKLIPKIRDYAYIVSPYGVVSSYGGYFIIGHHYLQGTRIYRVDKITGIKTIPIDAENGQYVERGFDLEEYVRNSAFMHAEEEKIDVDIHCKMEILDDVIERFDNCRIHEDNKDTGYFNATIPGTTRKGMRLWLLQFSTACEVLKPLCLRDEVREALANALKRYST